jgi:diguanylate cyclase (GGDEF)-like protein/PAS domain S-box-containing protein
VYYANYHRHPRSSRFKTMVLAALAAAWMLSSRPASARGNNPELVVGFFNFAPFVLNSNGVPTGMAVEILELAAKQASIRLKWVLLPVSGTEVALRSGRIDLFPIMTLTPERQAEFYASESWWENDAALISLETTQLHAGPAAHGKRIAIRGLQTLQVVARKAFPGSHLVVIPDAETMIADLCLGRIDGVFLDVRLLQSQLLKGKPVCVGHPLFVASVPGGSLSLGTVATRKVERVADLLYASIAELAIDGTLSATASRWSLVSSFQNRHMKDFLEARQRANLMRYSLAGLSLIVILSWIQAGRIRRARIATEESRQRFDAFMQHTPAVSLIKNVAGEVVYSNRPVLPEGMRIPGLNAGDSEALRLNCASEATEHVTLASGLRQHLLCLRFPFINPDGERFVGTVALDITERRKTEEALRFSQFSIDRSPDSIIWLNAQQKIFYSNEAASRSLGYSREELLAMAPGEIDPLLFQSGEAGPQSALHSSGFTTESAWRRRDGSTFPVELALYHVEFDDRDFVCCIARDITERKRVEGEMRFQARHDLLTGLANRGSLESQLNCGIENAFSKGTRLAVVYFDLDGFKLINDTLGHALGDALLKQLALRLATCLRNGDTLARMGGDEFAAIAPDVSDSTSAMALAAALLGCLEESFNLGGHELRVTASAGISLYPDDGLHGSVLLQNADAAMYEAKKQGKNQIRCFCSEMNAAVRERLELENDLRRALERGELQLHYQPEFSVGTGDIIRYESLLRWNQRGFGEISPAKFIPVAEETGLIVPIGNWVIEEACRYGRRLLEAGSGAGIAVNVSIMQFRRPDFEDVIVAALDASGLPACRLDLELTETIVTLGIDDSRQKISRLRARGVTVSIDDFGTGYSSLNYLLQLHADHLKIDRSFLQNVPRDPEAVAMMQRLTSLGHSLGMKVIVEGVESRAQMEAVRAMGCDVMQGYFLGFPMPETHTKTAGGLECLSRSLSPSRDAVVGVIAKNVANVKANVKTNEGLALSEVAGLFLV